MLKVNFISNRERKKSYLVLHTTSRKNNVSRLRLGDVAPVARLKEQFPRFRARLQSKIIAMKMVLLYRQCYDK